MKTRLIDFKTLMRHCDSRSGWEKPICQTQIDNMISNNSLYGKPFIPCFEPPCTARKCPVWKKLKAK